MAKQKATEDQFNELHNIVTTELINRLNNSENPPSTADIRAAIEWLHKNDITGTATGDNPLSRLFNLIPDIESADVVERVNGKQMVG